MAENYQNNEKRAVEFKDISQNIRNHLFNIFVYFLYSFINNNFKGNFITSGKHSYSYKTPLRTEK